MAQTIARGVALHYASAGSSGLTALADACELPGTFGIPKEQIQTHKAGGVPPHGHMPGNTEDDAAAGERMAHGIRKGDCIIAVSASDSTPFTLAFAQHGKDAGAHVIDVANNTVAPLMQLSATFICLESPPEVIAGFTLMAAGSEQKAAHNLMSTLMRISLGHLYRGLMVNLVANNAKLSERAAQIVARIADVPAAAAENALAKAGGSVNPAVLIAAGQSASVAQALLARHGGHLGPCLAF